MKCWKFDTVEACQKYMTSRVKNRLLDVEGTADLAAHYDSVATTGFTDNRLKQIFTQNLPTEPWKVGEALAECFLEDADDVRFPWNGCRDQKVDNASLPGADLIGFKNQNGKVRFLFGEVKTSNDSVNHPPNVMYGRSGMTKQLENLKISPETRSLLVRWFAFRAKNSDWESDYKTALAEYLSSDECVFLQGVLVRDCPPDIKDLKTRGQVLNNGKPAEMGISLYGIYCLNSITDFPTLMGGASL
jgi:hypothetical protein